MSSLTVMTCPGQVTPALCRTVLLMSDDVITRRTGESERVFRTWMMSTSLRHVRIASVMTWLWRSDCVNSLTSSADGEYKPENPSQSSLNVCDDWMMLMQVNRWRRSHIQSVRDDKRVCERSCVAVIRFSSLTPRHDISIPSTVSCCWWWSVRVLQQRCCLYTPAQIPCWATNIVSLHETWVDNPTCAALSAAQSRCLLVHHTTRHHPV